MFNDNNIKIILDFFINTITHLISLSETLALCSSAYILGIAHYEGLLNKTHYTFILIMLIFLGILFIFETIGFIRNKKYKKQIEV